MYQHIILIGDFAAKRSIAIVQTAAINFLFTFRSAKKLQVKKIFLFFLLLFSINSFSQPNDEKEVRKILTVQNEAWNRGDVDAFMLGYWNNDSLMFIGKSGVTYGYNNTLVNYKKRYPDTAAMGKLFFDILQVKKLSEEYYHVTGKWYLKRSIGDTGGHFTLLFRKIKGKWVIISDHSS